MLVWLVDAGGMTIVVSYFLVSVSFLMLRKNEPEMPRPYKIRMGKFVGWTAVLLSFGMFCLYLPGFPSALIWPYEWGIIIGWGLLGSFFFMRAALTRDARPVRHLKKELARGVSD